MLDFTMVSGLKKIWKQKRAAFLPPLNLNYEKPLTNRNTKLKSFSDVQNV